MLKAHSKGPKYLHPQDHRSMKGNVTECVDPPATICKPQQFFIQVAEKVLKQQNKLLELLWLCLRAHCVTFILEVEQNGRMEGCMRLCALIVFHRPFINKSSPNDAKTA